MKFTNADRKEIAKWARDPQLRRDSEQMESPTIGRGRGKIPRYLAIEVITQLSMSAHWSAAAKKRWRRERRLLASEPEPKYLLGEQPMKDSLKKYFNTLIAGQKSGR